MSLEGLIRKAKKTLISGLVGISAVAFSSGGNCVPTHIDPRPAGGNSGTNPPITPPVQLPVQPPVQPPSTPQLTVSAGEDVRILAGECADLHGTFSGGTPPYTVLWTSPNWDFPDNKSDVKSCPDETTTYQFTVKDSSSGIGSQRQDTMTVFIANKAGTGVLGLNTPREILTHEKVLEAFVNCAREDIIIAYEKRAETPGIVGNYIMRGKQVYPLEQELLGGSLQFWFQNIQNQIIMTLDEDIFGLPNGTLVSKSTKGEIIRGSLHQNFTIYSIQDANLSFKGGSCSLENLLILTGKKSENGQIAGTYFQTPLQIYSGPCIPFPSAGVFKLIPVGSEETKATNYTTLDFKQIFIEHGYDVYSPWPSQIKNDEFNSWGVFLSGLAPNLYDYLRSKKLGANTSFIPPAPGTNIAEPFSQTQGILAIPYIFNFDPPVYDAELKVWDGNGNKSVHKLIACSEAGAGGIMLDSNSIADPDSGFNLDPMYLRVRSNVPIRSIWLDSYPYQRTGAESIRIGR